jgi:hypothetical protein
LAAGHLEIIWHACYESGDDEIGSSADLEYLAQWHSEPGKLTASLLESGFIDKIGEDLYRVHDLLDHAPDYVAKRMKRENERRAKGITLSAVRAEAGRKGGLATARQTAANGQQMNSVCLASVKQTAANDRTPAPAPAPAHTPIVPKGTDYPSCFELTWEQYPKPHRTGKVAAYRAYQKAGKRLVARGLTKEQAAGFIHQRVIEFAASPKGNSEFVPAPAVWFNQGRYDDDPEAWNLIRQLELEVDPEDVDREKRYGN